MFKVPGQDLGTQGLGLAAAEWMRVLTSHITGQANYHGKIQTGLGAAFC